MVLETDSLMAQGSLSYLNNKSHGLHISPDMDVVCHRVDKAVAVIYLRHRLSKQKIAMTDSDHKLQVFFLDESRTELVARNDEFTIAWIESYCVLVDDIEVFSLHTQKQQFIVTSRDVKDSGLFFHDE